MFCTKMLAHIMSRFTFSGQSFNFVLMCICFKELDMTSSFVSKAALIAKRQLEQNPRSEKKKNPDKEKPKNAADKAAEGHKLQKEVNTIFYFYFWSFLCLHVCVFLTVVAVCPGL